MKKVFSYNSDIYKNAYLNWRTERHEPIHNMNVLADGYFGIVFQSIKGCLADNRDHAADVLIFPILFSMNHGIELFEKSICWSVNILLGYTQSYNTDSHDIRNIWYTVKQKITQFGFSSEAPKETFDSMIVTLESYLKELYTTIIRDSMDDARHNIVFSRYPHDKNKESFFYINQCKNVVVDLENLLVLCEDIYSCLSRLAGYYYDLVCRAWDSMSAQC